MSVFPLELGISVMSDKCLKEYLNSLKTLHQSKPSVVLTEGVAKNFDKTN